jgi:hypothetical protein
LSITSTRATGRCRARSRSLRFRRLASQTGTSALLSFGTSGYPVEVAIPLSDRTGRADSIPPTNDRVGSCHAACCVPRREITIHVDRRDYVVRAESAAAANEWKKVIQETLAKYKVRRRAECTPCRTMPGRMARSSIQLGILLWLHAHAAGARGVGARATQSAIPLGLFPFGPFPLGPCPLQEQEELVHTLDKTMLQREFAPLDEVRNVRLHGCNMRRAWWQRATQCATHDVQRAQPAAYNLRRAVHTIVGRWWASARRLASSRPRSTRPSLCSSSSGTSGMQTNIGRHLLNDT